MSGKGINIMKVCVKMLSEVRLDKNWGTSVDERTIYYQTQKNQLWAVT